MAAPLLTADNFLSAGLDIVCKHQNWRQFKHHCNIDRFKEAFGVIPETCVLIWDDLRAANDINSKSRVKHFLLAIRFLWKYENETDLGRVFDMCPKTVRKWWKHYVPKFERLLDPKVCVLL